MTDLILTTMLRMVVKLDLLVPPSPAVLVLHATLPLPMGALLFLVLPTNLIPTTMLRMGVKQRVPQLPMERALRVPLL